MLQGFSSLTDAFAVSVAKLPAVLPRNLSVMGQLHAPVASIRVSVQEETGANNASSPTTLITPEPAMRHDLFPAISLGLVLLALLGLTSLLARRRQKKVKRGRQGSFSDLINGSRARTAFEPKVRRAKSTPNEIEVYRKESGLDAITVAR